VNVPEVVLADVGTRRLSQPGCLGLVGEQEADGLAECPQVGGIRQQDAGAVGDLVDDPSDRRADHGPALPHSLGNGQPEPFCQALLRDDGGVPLQGVDHGRVLVYVVKRQRHQQNARPGSGRQVVPLQQAFPVHGRALRVVGHLVDSRAGQHQVSTAAGHNVVGEAAHDPRHVLEPVPAGDLEHHRIIKAGAALPCDDRLLGDDVHVAVAAHEPGGHLRRGTVKHAERGEDGLHGGGIKVLVLRGERVDRRRDDRDLVFRQPRWHVFPAREHVPLRRAQVRP
jgi:hypothetical protein